MRISTTECKSAGRVARVKGIPIHNVPKGLTKLGKSLWKLGWEVQDDEENQTVPVKPIIKPTEIKNIDPEISLGKPTQHTSCAYWVCDKCDHRWVGRSANKPRVCPVCKAYDEHCDNIHKYEPDSKKADPKNQRGILKEDLHEIHNKIKEMTNAFNQQALSLDLIRVGLGEQFCKTNHILASLESNQNTTRDDLFNLSEKVMQISNSV